MGEARVRSGPALAGAFALALAACADKLPVDSADHHTALPRARTYPEPTYTVPHSATDPAASAATPSSSSSAAPTAPADTCGAVPLAYLVGKPRTEIPIPADLLHRRVVCSTCPVTPDVMPDRQTITYDSATGLVTKVACG